MTQPTPATRLAPFADFFRIVFEPSPSTPGRNEARELQALARLEGHLLRDIGVTQDEVAAALGAGATHAARLENQMQRPAIAMHRQLW